tara:strand:+ start:190 stop:621 length:432 start_codon:yes stop_codon:yes gene_type:complete
MSAASTLGALGSDLAFSVSFGISAELLQAARQAGTSEGELTSIVLLCSVLLSALPSSLATILGRKSANTEAKSPSRLFEFAWVVLTLVQRILISVSVQLLASGVQSRSSLRGVRILSLVSVALFFLFLESSALVGRQGAKHPD